MPDTPLTDRILADLAGHPGTTAARIAARLDANKAIVGQLLADAMRRGKCTRCREPYGPWRWTASTDGGKP